MDQRAAGERDRVQRSNAVREAASQIVGKLTPERIVPAEFAAAQYVLAPAEVLTPAPTSIPLPDAAALPLVGLTAG